VESVFSDPIATAGGVSDAKDATVDSVAVKGAARDSGSLLSDTDAVRFLAGPLFFDGLPTGFALDSACSDLSSVVAVEVTRIFQGRPIFFRAFAPDSAGSGVSTVLGRAAVSVSSAGSDCNSTGASTISRTFLERPPLLFCFALNSIVADSITAGGVAVGRDVMGNVLDVAKMAVGTP